jgi:hypothetical protein
LSACCCFPLAADDGLGDGVEALTAPALSSAATVAAPTVLMATDANGIIASPQTRIGDPHNEVKLSERRRGAVSVS